MCFAPSASSFVPGVGTCEPPSVWLRLVVSAEELLNVVTFATSTCESGAGNKRVSSCTELPGDRPAGESADRCPEVRFPHGSIADGPALLARPAVRHQRRGKEDGPMDGRAKLVLEPIHRDSGCVSADFARGARDVGRAEGRDAGTRLNYARFAGAFLRTMFADGQVVVAQIHPRDVRRWSLVPLPADDGTTRPAGQGKPDPQTSQWSDRSSPAVHLARGRPRTAVVWAGHLVRCRPCGGM